ncbi:hypothetical protein QAD02_004909 [Eretmocerus hayati]|uniref:Uncharacterized protein n=1 Tax=Eretmocerus hayati TaxID=131215 RepID=A0ACC2NTU6_9HYME|nr:hypothetical protein QAD02_004909 [Eretmocerus hayati]
MHNGKFTISHSLAVDISPLIFLFWHLSFGKLPVIPLLPDKGGFAPAEADFALARSVVLVAGAAPPEVRSGSPCEGAAFLCEGVDTPRERVDSPCDGADLACE